ncbi:MAG: hypothetical protein JSV85_03485, partial [Candidatus Bathyarchaeota archaeon]
MKIKITSQKHNPLLKRKEITFRVNHEKTGSTPTRLEVRKELAATLKMDMDVVYVKRMITKTGTRIAVGTATAYDSAEQVNLVEPKHILARHAPPKKPEKQEEAAEKLEKLGTVEEKEGKAEAVEEEKKEG